MTARFSFLPVSWSKDWYLLPVGTWIVLSVPMAFSAGVDLWCRTLVHLLLLSLCVALVWGRPLSISTLIGKSATLGGLWIFVLFSLALSTYRSGAPACSREALLYWLDCFLLFVLAASFNDRELRLMRRMLFLSWTVLCGVGLSQSLFLRQTPTAGMLNPNVLGGYLLIPLFLGLQQCREIRGLEGKIFIPFTMACSVLLLATRSSGAVVAFLVGLSYILWRDPPRWDDKRVALPLTIATVGILGIWKVIHHWDSHRWIWWKAAVNMAGSHPMVGNGLGTFEIGLPHWQNMNMFSLYAHNVFLQWGAEAGILGLIGIFGLLSICLREQGNPYTTGATISFLLHNVTDYSFLLPAHTLVFWALQATATQTRQAMAISRTDPLMMVPLTNDSIHSTGRRCGRPIVPTYTTSLFLTLILSTLAWIGFQRFRADQEYAQANYQMQIGNVQVARNGALRSINLYPADPAPFVLLAKSFKEIGINTHSRADLDQALAYTLDAIEREPIQPTHWTDAIELYKALGYSALGNGLATQLVTRYPYLKSDKRLQTYL